MTTESTQQGEDGFSPREAFAKRAMSAHFAPIRSLLALFVLVFVACTGCGTTKWTDTRRTATEQLLISDAVDKAVQVIDFTPISGEKVYFEDKNLSGVVDEEYVVSSIRQHMLASGCTLTDKRDKADYVVEARAGAVGTDRHDVLYGIPATTVPTMVNIPGVPSQIPEIPFAKRTDQLGVAKLAVFAYERETGNSVWQSGIASRTSRAKDIWLLGAGPFQKGTIYSGTAFAGQKIKNPLNPWSAIANQDGQKGVPLTASAVFLRDEKSLGKSNEQIANSKDKSNKGAAKPSDGAEQSLAEKQKKNKPTSAKVAKSNPQGQGPAHPSVPGSGAVVSGTPPGETPRISLLPPVTPESIRPDWLAPQYRMAQPPNREHRYGL